MSSSARVSGLIQDVFKRRFGHPEETSGGGEKIVPPDVVPAMPLAILFDCFVEVLKDGKLSHSDLDPSVTAAEELFEQYVRPFDIPGIGPVTERFVDDLMKQGIRPVLTGLFDKLLPA